jgi:hypothetical protein
MFERRRGPPVIVFALAAVGFVAVAAGTGTYFMIQERRRQRRMNKLADQAKRVFRRTRARVSHAAHA